ncbi:MAG: hypothetical protein IKT09_08155 [Synergistes sp.]|nr:hypothetical protein [Synergistes sp.]
MRNSKRTAEQNDDIRERNTEGIEKKSLETENENLGTEIEITDIETSGQIKEKSGEVKITSPKYLMHLMQIVIRMFLNQQVFPDDSQNLPAGFIIQPVLFKTPFTCRMRAKLQDAAFCSSVDFSAAPRIM